jgi:YYY domain-containing protein
VALLGLVVGSLRWLNSWDYPPFLLVGLAAIVISERWLEGGLASASMRGAGKVLLLAGLSFLLFKPFLDSYAAPVSGLISSPETTPPDQYLAHFGVLLAPVVLWLLFLAARALRSSRAASSGYSDGVPLTAGVVAWCIAAFALPLTMAYAALEGQWLIAVLLPVVALVMLLAARELRSRRPDAGLRLFLLALLGLGLGLSIGVDLVTIKGDIERMNTVFKFYLHAWAVFSIVAAFGVWQLAFVLWRPAMHAGSRSLAKAGGSVAAAALVSLLVAAGLYPLLATPVRLDDRFEDLPATLDGTAYMREAIYNDQKGPLELTYDYEGIQWLRQNVEGSPAIVEGRADLYRWGGRFSIYTGLPAVVGWDWHERQQRGELAHLVEQRGREVDAFYTSQDVDQAQRFLRRYSVQYVILGQLERNYYPAAGLRKLQSGLGGALEVAYENEQLTIYRVK